MARVKVPNTIGRFIRLPEESADGQGRPEVRLVRVEEIIAANLDELFPGKEIVGELRLPGDAQRGLRDRGGRGRGPASRL